MEVSSCLSSRYGREYSRTVDGTGLVSQAEAAAIVRPPVSRIAVHKWVKSGKLTDHKVKGVSMILLSELRLFAAKHGYEMAPIP